MVKVNTKDTDNLSEKGFAKIAFHSEKNKLISDRFNKNFVFKIFTLLLQKSC